MVLKPSEIRSIILAEHGELRQRLAGIEALLDGLSRGDAAARHDLRTSFVALCELFVTHIAHEEAILRPILADIDGWGPVRVELMDEEHVEQRKRVAELSQLHPDTDPGAYVRSVREFVTDLRKDMDGEEHECLSPDVLRDDTTSIDAFGG